MGRKLQKHPQLATSFTTLRSEWQQGLAEVGRMRCLPLESVCVLPAGTGPAALERWPPQQITLTVQWALLSTPRSEVWDPDSCEPRVLLLTRFQNPF